MWTGQWGWYNALMLSMMGLMMVFLVLPEHLKIWMIPGTVIYLLAFWGIQNKVILAKKEKIEGNRFIDARIVRDKGYSEDLLLGFANFELLDLGNNDKKIEDIDFYRKLKKTVKHKMLTDRISIELEMQSTDNIFNSGNFLPLNDKKDKEDIQKTITVKPSNSELTTFYSQEIQTLEEAEIRVNKDREKVFMEFLQTNSLYAYSGDLYEGVAFNDSQEHKFDTCILICRGELETELLFSKLELLVEGYEVSAQAAKAELITIAWIGSYCPIFLIDYTERHAVNKLDKVITGTLLQTIKERTMEKWIFSKKHFFKRFEAQLRRKDIEIDNVSREHEDLLQDLEDRKIDDGYPNPAENSQTMKISKKLYIGFISIACLCVILLGTLIGVLI